MNKIDIKNRAKKSALIPEENICAEMPQVEKTHQYDDTIQFVPEKSNVSDFYEERAAILQFDGMHDLKTAELIALREIKKLNEKQKNLKPAVAQYWESIFKNKECLYEREIIDILLEDNFLEPSPSNNTKMLNKLFQAEFDGYICSDEGPHLKTHKYVLAKNYIKEAI